MITLSALRQTLTTVLSMSDCDEAARILEGSCLDAFHSDHITREFEKDIKSKVGSSMILYTIENREEAIEILKELKHELENVIVKELLLYNRLKKSESSSHEHVGAFLAELPDLVRMHICNELKHAL